MRVLFNNMLFNLTALLLNIAAAPAKYAALLGSPGIVKLLTIGCLRLMCLKSLAVWSLPGLVSIILVGSSPSLSANDASSTADLTCAEFVMFSKIIDLVLQ